MAKKKDTKKNAPNTVNKSDPQQEGAKKTNLSDAYMETIKESFTQFNKLSSEERVSIYGNRKFLDQFWLYFKKENPDLLSKLSREELPLYLSALEKKGFSIGNIKENADSLHEEFTEESTELHVMEYSLKDFGAFCHDEINNIPVEKYKKFSKEMGFDYKTGVIDPDVSKLKTIDDLWDKWERFAEKEGLELKEGQQENIQKILMPDYNPTERLMVKIAVTKLRNKLKGKLRDDFDSKFDTEVNVFSKIQSLNSFRNTWVNFLTLHAGEIDEDLAKELDSLTVSNSDIKKELFRSERKFDESKSFHEWEHHFRIIFNKLASRQLFEEMKETQRAIDYYSNVIIDGTKAFPPYVNELFKIYPHDEQALIEAHPDLPGELISIDQQIAEKENVIIDGDLGDEEQKDLRADIRSLKEQRETFRWDAYIKLLSQQDEGLANAMKVLVDNKFDFSHLHAGAQQILVNALVKNKLGDLIKNKAPDLLSTDEEELRVFVDDLFDLKKMDVSIPTNEGPINIKFTKKEFVAKEMERLLSIEELGQLESLPLNFEVAMTPSSEKFFEESVIFHSMFGEFNGRNKRHKINDAYKVSLTKDGKTAEGYLSHYSPIGSRNISQLEESGVQQGDPDVWYLYSQPINSPSDERELMTWDGTDEGDPVFVTTDEEDQCHLEVLEKKLNLNSAAIGALMAGFILGQQSFYHIMSLEEEQKLKEKFDKLETYQDINEEGEPIDEDGKTVDKGKEASEEKKEKTEVDKFLEEWGRLDGYKFADKEQDKGFREGSRILIKAGTTAYPPLELGGDSWMWLDIVRIDRERGTFTVKIHGGESSLGKMEGSKKELPMNSNTFDNIKDALSDNKQIYKFPNMKGKSFDHILGYLKSSGNEFADIFKNNFDKIKWDNGFKFSVGDFVGEKVEYFGYDETMYSGDKGGKTETEIVPVYYKIIYNANGTVTIKNDTEFVDEKTKKPFRYEQTMDRSMFVLFVASKKLQPKPIKTLQEESRTKATDDEGYNKRMPWFSISNIAGFFSSGFNKIQDGIKKYDEEKTDDLTDIMLADGKVFEKVGQRLGGVFTRVGYGMERAGMEYYQERDNRVWRKIERWQKIYEGDPHFSSFFKFELKKMYNSDYRPKDMYKIPAMLLAVINKEKSPYGRSFEFMGKGQWVNLILGKEHQQRFLDKFNKYQEDVKQNSLLYGVDWTVFMNEEIVKMEMKYLVGVIDGREDQVNREHEKFQANKRSRQFTEKLQEAMDTKFGFTGIESKHKELSKGTRFEVAEYEYNRFIRTNRISKALPFFKIMAEQAQNDKQWSIFQMHVVAAMLSGWRWNHTDAYTKGWLKDIVRTAGVLPGLYAKDPLQQTKVFRLLEISSNGEFGKAKAEFGPIKGQNFKEIISGCTSSQMENVYHFVTNFKDWRINKGNGADVSKFLFDPKGVNKNGKTLVELANDSDVSNDDKAILKEYLNFGEERSEDLDPDVRHNPSAMGLAPFTKSETIVKLLMKYENGEFEGKDSHEQLGPKEFWINVKKELPKGKVSDINVIFYVRKFLNWFGGIGFEGSDRTIFVKRLKTISDMLKQAETLSEPQKSERKKEANDTLMYTINGTIIANNSGGRGVPPIQFMDGLDVFKNFFKDNLDAILQSDIISATMGSQYVEDSQDPYKIGDWAEYVELSDTAALISATGEEKTRKAEARTKYKSSKYMNEELYKLADGLSRSHSIENEFKKYYDPDAAQAKAKEEAETRVQLERNLSAKASVKGVKIKNDKTIEKLESALSGGSETPLETDLPDDVDDVFLGEEEVEMEY